MFTLKTWIANHAWMRRASSLVRLRKAKPDPNARTKPRRLAIESLEIRTVLSASAIVNENLLPGSPASQWDIVGVGDTSIQGYATRISVNLGETVSFKIDNQNLAPYRLDIYRIGYYGGDGARKVAVVPSTETLAQSQPLPLTDAATGLVDAGNWSVSASWNVPSTAVSGVYIARVVREDNGGASHIIFVVRDDDGHSDLLLQTSDTTWQAYNRWGGNSLYVGQPNNRAYAVSYNRPFDTRATTAKDWFFSNEYAMIRWVEKNGYDVSYTTGVDSEVRGAEILEHKAFVSVGHDEYWSGNQRTYVEAARAAGVHLAFFSGNEIYWKTRWENSIDASGTPYRTLVCYKETWANSKIDPAPNVWTGTWRDNRFSPPADGGRPENSLSGQIFTVNRGPGGDLGTPITVGDAYSQLRFWRNTRIANLQPGQTENVGDFVLGYEWDEDLDNGARPNGLFHLSSTTQLAPQKIDQYGGPTTTSGQATHNLSLYRSSSGALVFGAGTINWGWGLDGTHDILVSNPDPALEQATVNLFADMGAQPLSLRTGLILSNMSTDVIAASSSITSVANGATIESGSSILLSGVALDSGGGVVAGVDISVDGGATWHHANGRANWTYYWVPTSSGPITIQSRAVDDSGNIQSTPASVSVIVSPSTSSGLWNASVVPTVTSTSDTSAVELGVRFQSTINGFVSGVKFYKGSGNQGVHVGRLWSSTGNLLASVTFTAETATGWQTASFNTPVAVTAGTSYVASYFAPNGGYAFDGSYFTNDRVSGPLIAPASGNGGGNGLYNYGANGGFPANSYNAANYWVDVDFAEAIIDNLPPTVVRKAPNLDATNVSVFGAVSADFSEAVQSNLIAFTLAGPLGGSIAAIVTYDDTLRRITLKPSSALTNNTLYTAVLSNVRDLVGNLMPTISWSFTTGTPVIDGSIWSSATVPGIASVNEFSSVELGVKFQADRDGYVSGLRYYKGSLNTGNHTGNLWSATGALLATATFTSESSSGWQTVRFATPVAIVANTIYVASYFAPSGGFAFDLNYFTTSVNNGSLRAPSTTESNGNGLYRYGSQSAFPNSSYNASNYWVDVLFSEVLIDSTPPTASELSPIPNTGGNLSNSNVSARLSEPVLPQSIVFQLRDTNNAIVPSQVNYDPATRLAVLVPTSLLLPNIQYTAALDATDLAGNAMTRVTWLFTIQGSWLQTTQADFVAGQTVNTTVTTTGEVRMATQFTDDFAGTALSATSWTTTSLATGSTVPVASGVLTVRGRQVLSTATYPSQSIEGVVQFTAIANQHFGLATSMAVTAGNSWAVFSTRNSATRLFARINVAGAIQEVDVGAISTSYRTYQIRKTATGYQFSVDGVQVASMNAAISLTAGLRIVMSNASTTTAGRLLIDRVNVLDVAAPRVAGVYSATFESVRYDGLLSGLAWKNVNWTADIPNGTGILVELIASDQANFAGASYVSVSNAQDLSLISLRGRYLKYRVTFTTTSPLVFPVFRDITLGF
jgi:hypothetical protein